MDIYPLLTQLLFYYGKCKKKVDWHHAVRLYSAMTLFIIMTKENPLKPIILIIYSVPQIFYLIQGIF